MKVKTLKKQKTENIGEKRDGENFRSHRVIVNKAKHFFSGID